MEIKEFHYSVPAALASTLVEMEAKHTILLGQARAGESSRQESERGWDRVQQLVEEQSRALITLRADLNRTQAQYLAACARLEQVEETP